jgi:hypothetical protein
MSFIHCGGFVVYVNGLFDPFKRRLLIRTKGSPSVVVWGDDFKSWCSGSFPALRSSWPFPR